MPAGFIISMLIIVMALFTMLEGHLLLSLILVLIATSFV